MFVVVITFKGGETRTMTHHAEDAEDAESIAWAMLTDEDKERVESIGAYEEGSK